MYLTMTSQTYFYAMLILNIVDVAPKKYICEEPTGGNGAFLPSVEANEIKHLRITRRIGILPNNSFAGYWFIEVCHQMKFNKIRINTYTF